MYALTYERTCVDIHTNTRITRYSHKFARTRIPSPSLALASTRTPTQSNSNARTLSFTRIRTYLHAHTHEQTPAQTNICTHNFACTHNRKHSNSRADFHALLRTLTRMFPPSQALTLASTLTDATTHNRANSHSYAFTLALTHTDVPTHTVHLHWHAVTLARSCSLSTPAHFRAYTKLHRRPQIRTCTYTRKSK